MPSSNGQMWIVTARPPLFIEPISGHPIQEKLSAMKTALASGADPNELDHQPRAERNQGRPLHMAIEYTMGDLSRLHENLPVVELLLQHGADPRLPGMWGRPAPMEDLKLVLEFDDGTLRVARPFFRDALELMERKAGELEGAFLFRDVRVGVEKELTFFRA